MHGSFCDNGTIERIDLRGPATGDILKHGRVVPCSGRELDITEEREVIIW